MPRGPTSGDQRGAGSDFEADTMTANPLKGSIYEIVENLRMNGWNKQAAMASRQRERERRAMYLMQNMPQSRVWPYQM